MSDIINESDLASELRRICPSIGVFFPMLIQRRPNSATPGTFRDRLFTDTYRNAFHCDAAEFAIIAATQDPDARTAKLNAFLDERPKAIAIDALTLYLARTRTVDADTTARLSERRGVRLDASGCIPIEEMGGHFLHELLEDLRELEALRGAGGDVDAWWAFTPGISVADAARHLERCGRQAGPYVARIFNALKITTRNNVIPSRQWTAETKRHAEYMAREVSRLTAFPDGESLVTKYLAA